MRKSILIFTALLCYGTWGFGQKKLDRAIKRWNRGSVPYIEVFELAQDSSLLVLDTRRGEEYYVSHLKDALWVGEKDTVQLYTILKEIPKETPIVVYCSIGVRSEDVGERLIRSGYTQVRNLYGGIFRWKNQGFPVYDTLGNPTDKIHAFNKYWRRLLENGEKVY